MDATQTGTAAIDTAPPSQRVIVKEGATTGPTIINSNPLGLGPKAWVAQFGAIGLIFFGCIVFGYQFLGMTKVMQEQVLNSIKEARIDDRAEKEAVRAAQDKDRAERDKDREVTRLIIVALEKNTGELVRLAVIVDRLERRMDAKGKEQADH